MAAEIGPSEPWLGTVVGLYFLAATLVTFWLLFGNPHKSREPKRTDE
jgi:hypothetical protein